MLEIDGLTHHFGARPALVDVGFTVAGGSMVGFVGRNGAGKTTTMRAVLGLLRTDAGTVRWDGTEPTASVRRRQFGYMPEERGLYPKMKVDEQLRYLARLSGLDAAAATEAVDRWLARLELDDRASSVLDDLSLGNQQRVQLAAALLHRPQLLVLDEPFSGLDPVGVDLLAAALRDEVAAGTAVVFSSHQLELVERICDAVVIIDAGRIVADGPIARLRAARTHRQLRVEMADEVGGRGSAWCDGVPEVVAATSHPDGGLLVTLADGADPDRVLDAARAAGSVRHFSESVPTLAQLYREMVAA